MIKELRNIATAGLSASESRMLGNALKMKTKDLDLFPDDLYNAECFMAVINIKAYPSSSVKRLQRELVHMDILWDTLIVIGDFKPPVDHRVKIYVYPDYISLYRDIDLVFSQAFKRVHNRYVRIQKAFEVHKRIYDDDTKKTTRQLCNNINKAIFEYYGTSPDELIISRIKAEWNEICSRGLADHIAMLHEMSHFMRTLNIPYHTTGSTASSLIMFLLKITRCNPLPPHYYCPKCHRVRFVIGYETGFDLPDDVNFGRCCIAMNGDGHDIPYLHLWGSEKEMRYGINVPPRVMPIIRRIALDYDVGLVTKPLEKDQKRCLISSDGYFTVTSAIDTDKVSQEYYYEHTPDIRYLRRYTDKMMELNFEYGEDVLPDSYMSMCTPAVTEENYASFEVLGLFGLHFIEDIYGFLSDRGFSSSEACRYYKSLLQPQALPLAMLTKAKQLGVDRDLEDIHEYAVQLTSKAEAAEALVHRMSLVKSRI